MKKVIHTDKALCSIEELRRAKEEIKEEMNEIEENALENILNPQQVLIELGLSALTSLIGSASILKSTKKQGMLPLLANTLKIAGKILPIKPLTRMWFKAQLFNTAVILGKKTAKIISQKVKKDT